MGTAEQVVAMLFVQDIRKEARAKADEAAGRGVKCLREEPCWEAFVREWTVAKLAWVERHAMSLTDSLLRDALAHRISDAVTAYDGGDDVRYVDYRMVVIEREQSTEATHGVASLFLRGFRNRMRSVPRKPGLFGKKELTPHQQVEIMDAVGKACWTLDRDLEVVLEAIRPRVTRELMDLV